MATPLSLPTSPDVQSAGRSPILGASALAGERRQDVNPEALSALDTYKVRDTSKGTQQNLYTCTVYTLILCPLLIAVVVRFKAVGNAPIMKQNFYKITASNRFQTVIQFLRKELGWKSGDPLVRNANSIYLFIALMCVCRLGLQ